MPTGLWHCRLALSKVITTQVKYDQQCIVWFLANQIIWKNTSKTSVSWRLLFQNRCTTRCNIFYCNTTNVSRINSMFLKVKSILIGFIAYIFNFFFFSLMVWKRWQMFVYNFYFEYISSEEVSCFLQYIIIFSFEKYVWIISQYSFTFFPPLILSFLFLSLLFFSLPFFFFLFLTSLMSSSSSSSVISLDCSIFSRHCLTLPPDI